MTTKRIISSLCALLLTLTLFACGTKTKSTGTERNPFDPDTEQSDPSFSFPVGSLPDPSSEPSSTENARLETSSSENSSLETSSAENSSLETSSSENSSLETSSAENSSTSTKNSSSSTSTSTKKTSTSTSAPRTSEKKSSTKASLPSSKADILKTFISAVELARNGTGSVKKSSSVSIAKPLDGDADAKKLLGAEVAGFKVQSEVCKLFGEGSSQKTGGAKELLMACSLSTEDISSASLTQNNAGEWLIKLSVKDAKNPTVGQADSSIGRFTRDFFDQKTVSNGIADAQKKVPGLKINIGGKSFSYNDIQITATLRDGKLLTLKHHFQYQVRAEQIEAKVLLVPLGKGAYASGNATANHEFTF